MTHTTTRCLLLRTLEGHMNTTCTRAALEVGAGADTRIVPSIVMFVWHHFPV